MKITVISILLITLSISGLMAQETKTDLSVHDCVQIAIKNNISIRKARFEKTKSEYKVTESRSSLLPQVSVSADFRNDLKMPVTMIPGDFVGQAGEYIPLTMGVKYNASTSITVNQVLYNQTRLAELKLAKKNEFLSRLSIQQANENLTQEVIKLYFLAQTTAEQKQIIKGNIIRTERMANITKIQVENGIKKQVDYDRISVALENLRTQFDNTEALHQQQLNMVKYLLEMPLEQQIALTDSVSMPLLDHNPTIISDFSEHIDVQILNQEKDIARLKQKAIKSEYLPTLSFTGQFAYQGSREHFKDYFNSGPMNKWYNSSYIGINLSIPIFDGFNRKSRLNQAKIDYQVSDMTFNNTKKQYNINYKNAINDFYNNKNNVQRQIQNIALAHKVYTETSLRYKEGMATMSDILQDEISLSDAQVSYLNALYNFKEAELAIMMLSGEIKKIIEN